MIALAQIEHLEFIRSLKFLLFFSAPEKAASRKRESRIFDIYINGIGDGDLKFHAI